MADPKAGAGLTPEELLSLDLRGYFIRRAALTKPVLDRWQNRLEELEWRNGDTLPKGVWSVWTPTIDEFRIINLLQSGSSFDDMVDCPAWLEAVREVVPQPMRMTECYSITRGAGIGLLLHWTRAPIATYGVVAGQPQATHLKIAICLEDCGPDDGPFCVIEGSHKIGVPFLYTKLNPNWRETDRDHEVFEFLKKYDDRNRGIPWEDIPGFRELCTKRGDFVVFTENLIHGAQGRRSPGFRRTVYAAYSPFHFCNWHGVSYGEDVLGRLTNPRRDLVREPFCGHVYAQVPHEHDASLARVGFDPYPNSLQWDQRLRNDPVAPETSAAPGS